MRTVTATLESISPYSQSKHIMVESIDREGKDDYEKRTWRERMHYDKDGFVFMPPMSFKKSLDRAAAFRGEKIKGKGQATYSKHFLAGVLVMDPLKLKVKKDDVPGEWLFVPADGKPGGNTRVSRCFPVIHEWKGEVVYHILDDAVITENVFERHITDSGNFIGVGRFRPERGGFYGRYKVVDLKWS